MAEHTHVYPQSDSKPHVMSLSETCWCIPQELVEAVGFKTCIHHPIKPVVQGHDLNLTKQILNG